MGEQRRSPNAPADRDALLAEGWAESELGPGIARVTHVLGSARAEPPVTEAGTRVARFVHLADYQLADDEAVSRVASLDVPGPGSGAFRPQEGFGCHIVDAAHRTIAALHRESPLDFALMGGDNIDNAQRNELDWFLTLVRGGPIECDSGFDDDLVPGELDEKDPFIAYGLVPPMYWVSGNHDVSIQGEAPVVSALQDASRGGAATFGTRDYRQPGGPVVTGVQVPADSRRELMQRTELLSAVLGDGAGHGLSRQNAANGSAFYTFDQGPLRFLVMDTTAVLGGHAGVLRRADVETFVLPALQQARAAKKSVVLVSHHSTNGLTNDGGIGLLTDPDAMTTAEWLAFLEPHEHVILSLVAHSHAHRLRRLKVGQRELFEVMTSSLIDYPGQFRLIEAFAVGSSWWRFDVTAVDYDDHGSPLVARGRDLMFLDFVSGWGAGSLAPPNETNVELWIPRAPLR